MDESQKPKISWWQTLPGVLTAVATAATAIAGLIGVLNQTGLIGDGNEKKPAAAKGVITSPQVISDNRPTVALCSARDGYPLGRWGVKANSESSAEFSTFITFTRPNGGTWLPYSGQGSFEAFPVPSPGAEVIIRLRPESGGYLSTNKLVVSSDGCRMDGTFSDSEGHRGEASYFYEIR